jgi:hypothetical protein
MTTRRRVDPVESPWRRVDPRTVGTKMSPLGATSTASAPRRCGGHVAVHGRDKYLNLLACGGVAFWCAIGGPCRLELLTGKRSISPCVSMCRPAVPSRFRSPDCCGGVLAGRGSVRRRRRDGDRAGDVPARDRPAARHGVGHAGCARNRGPRRTNAGRHQRHRASGPRRRRNGPGDSCFRY